MVTMCHNEIKKGFNYSQMVDFIVDEIQKQLNKRIEILVEARV